MKKRIIIIGAAGRDFHNFNTLYKNNPRVRVVVFTAAQIPGIANKIYPPSLAGKQYKKGIPIISEEKLAELIKEKNIDECVLSYSDLSFSEIMFKASIVNSAGADFKLLNPYNTMLKSKKPVIAVTAVRTGSGKSPLTRWIMRLLISRGKKTAVIRHPMPYGDLKKQAVQRFASYEDLKEATVEEREEYEPIIRLGGVVFTGVDYEKILKKAEKEADVIIWDGGNNDTPFIRPDLWIVVADALRPGHEVSYYPGVLNFMLADVIIINKQSKSTVGNVRIIKENAIKINPKAVILDAAMEVSIKEKGLRGKKAIVIEDGPTLTHGGMSYGAGAIAAEKTGAIVLNARKYAVGSIKKTIEKYPHLKKVLPAMGYSKNQLKDLKKTIEKAPCSIVINGSPADLSKLIKINKRIINVNYEIMIKEEGKMKKIIMKKIEEVKR